MEKMIIVQMQAIVNQVVKNFKTDFVHDVNELEGFEGKFFWIPRENGTHLMLVPMDSKSLEWLFLNKNEKYIFGYSYPRDIMRNQARNFDSDPIKNSEHIYFYNGVKLVKINLEEAKQAYQVAIKLQLKLAVEQGSMVIA